MLTLFDFRYHEFGIELPISCHVTVEREDVGVAKEEYALLSRVPLDLDEKTLETVMRSKSKKIEYRVRDVVGKPLGRVQYFLNKTFFQLVEERRIKSINGLVPTHTVSYLD